MQGPERDWKAEEERRMGKSDRAAGILALVSFLTMLAGMFMMAMPVIVTGFIGLFLAACWFGVAF